MLYIICAGESAVLSALVDRAARRGCETVVVAPENLLNSRYTLTPISLKLNENDVSHVLFLHGTNFSLKPYFEELDGEFAEAEIRALFAALSKLPLVRCLNGLDAVQWFTSPGLEYFMPETIEVSCEGRVWLPFRGVQPSALTALTESAFPIARVGSNNASSIPFICGKRLDGKPLSSATKKRLGEMGIDFGWLLLSVNGEPLSVSPVLDDPSLTNNIAVADALLDATIPRIGN